MSFRLLWDDVGIAVFGLVEHSVGLFVAKDLLGLGIELHLASDLVGSACEEAEGLRLVSFLNVGMQDLVVALSDGLDPVLEMGEVFHGVTFGRLTRARFAVGAEEGVVAAVIRDDQVALAAEEHGAHREVRLDEGVLVAKPASELVYQDRCS